jgi:hypothetical protein
VALRDIRATGRLDRTPAPPNVSDQRGVRNEGPRCPEQPGRIVRGQNSRTIKTWGAPRLHRLVRLPRRWEPAPRRSSLWVPSARSDVAPYSIQCTRGRVARRRTARTAQLVDCDHAWLVRLVEWDARNDHGSGL